MGQVPREAQSTRGFTNLDSVPLKVIVCKHFNERSFHQRKKWQTILVNNSPWQIILKPLIWTLILGSIITCFVNVSVYSSSQAFCCCWWKWENARQKDRVTSLPFWKSAVSSYSDNTARLSIDPSLAPPQHCGRAALKNNPPLQRRPRFCRGALCSVTQFRNFRSELRERAGCTGSPNPPGVPKPPVPGRVSSCGRLVAPCADRTARSAGWHGRVASRFAFCSPEWASPSFSEPHGHAFGFSFSRVTFARRIKEQEQLLAAAAGASPALPEETT